MGDLNIDTKLARRDLKRVSTALADLEIVKTKYSNTIVNLEALYKGDASKYLQEQIKQIKIKKIDAMIGSLKTAESQLKIAIQQAEATNKSVLDAIQNK